jgi:hypothetical protein
MDEGRPHCLTVVPAFGRRLQDAPFRDCLRYQRVTVRTQGKKLTAPGRGIDGVAITGWLNSPLRFQEARLDTALI